MEDKCPKCGSPMEVSEGTKYTQYICNKCGYKIMDLEMAYD